jgi:hypothetical protein
MDFQEVGPFQIHRLKYIGRHEGYHPLRMAIATLGYDILASHCSRYTTPSAYVLNACCYWWYACPIDTTQSVPNIVCLLWQVFLSQENVIDRSERSPGAPPFSRQLAAQPLPPYE